MEPPVADLDGNPTRSHRSSMKVRLSCELCRQRKVKCDKLSPCSNCRRIGAVCSPVERPRLPRGRYKAPKDRLSGSENDLRNRVADLERLIRDLIPEHISSSANSGTPPVTNSDHATSSGTLSDFPFEACWNQIPSMKTDSRLDAEQKAHPMDSANIGNSNTGRFLGGSFWADLVHETRGLRELLDRPSKNDSPLVELAPSIDAQLLGLIDQQNFGAGSQRPGSSIEILGQYFTPQMKERLCQVYVHQVDPVFKVLHRPSLTAYLMEGKQYLDYKPGHPAVEALTCSVYYAATCSLTEEQCLSIFRESKAPVVARYRLASDMSLARAGFVMTDDLTVLQAFVLSLLSTRSHDRSRQAWTLLSVAVRIAQALSLHLEHPPFPVPIFELEMRRRLWYAIGLLDVQASLDRASEPMLPASWMKSNLPSRVNDSDFWFGFEGSLQESDSFTDMNYTLMICKAQYTVRLLNFAPAAEPGVSNMYVRQKYVDDFRHTAFMLLRSCDADTTPFHWYARQVADGISASMQLVAVRPLQRHPNCSPPQVRGSSLLKLSVEVLQKSQAPTNDPRGFPWSWLEGIFVPWHALAVAIAELCVCESRSLMERYWPPVELAVDRLSNLVADSRHGMLWKPIESLMERARTKMIALLIHPLPQNRSSSIEIAPVQVYQAVVGGPSLPPTSTEEQGIDFGTETQAATNAAPPSDGFDTWPSLWETGVIGDGGLEDQFDTAWANWEEFIDDLQFGDDCMFRSG